MTIKHAPFAALGNALRNAAEERMEEVQKASRKAYLEMRKILSEQNSQFDKERFLAIHECLFGIYNNAFTKLEVNTMCRTINGFKEWTRAMENESYQVGDLRYPDFISRAEDALQTEVYRWLNDKKD